MAEHGPFADARYAEVRDRDGHRLGTLEQVFLSADTGEPRWVEVAGGLYGMARGIVPAAGARRSGDVLVLDVTAEAVAHSPRIDPEDGITAAEDSELTVHYGLRAGHGTHTCQPER